MVRKKATTLVKMVSNGNSYEIDKLRYDQIESLCFYAGDNMTSPYVFHTLAHIYDATAFKQTKRNFIKLFKRQLKKKFKPLKQELPSTLLAYSVEFKKTTQKEIDNDADAYRVGNSVWGIGEEELDFLHIHIYVIADCKKTIPNSCIQKILEVLNEMDGLRAARYFKSRKNQQFYMKLKDNFDDVFQRMLYIGKIEQKTADIPYRNTFGMSTLPVIQMKEAT